MGIKDVVDDVVEYLPGALDLLETLVPRLPAAEGAAIACALKTIRVLLEEGENTADAVRKVREVYAARGQAILDQFQQ